MLSLLTQLLIPSQTLYLQDCGSTHGTYMNDKKLEQGVEHVIRDGVVITFGQRVTSGAGVQFSSPNLRR